MKEQKTTKWSNFNPLCLARHVLRNLWMTVLAGLICVWPPGAWRSAHTAIPPLPPKWA